MCPNLPDVRIYLNLPYRPGSTWVDATLTMKRSGTNDSDIEADMKDIVVKELTDMVASDRGDGYEFAASVSVEDPKPGTVCTPP